MVLVLTVVTIFDRLASPNQSFLLIQAVLRRLNLSRDGTHLELEEAQVVGGDLNSDRDFLWDVTEIGSLA